MTTGLSPGFGMKAANRAIRHLSADAERRQGRERRARAGIAAVDRLLDILEERHLKGESIRVPIQPGWRSMLEESGLRVPAYVLRARTTVVLHSNLLDWQEELLDEFNPNRETYLAKTDERDAELVQTGVLLRLKPRAQRRHRATFMPQKQTA